MKRRELEVKLCSKCLAALNTIIKAYEFDSRHEAVSHALRVNARNSALYDKSEPGKNGKLERKRIYLGPAAYTAMVEFCHFNTVTHSRAIREALLFCQAKIKAEKMVNAKIRSVCQ
jgi:hypothetical protein